MEEKKNIKKNKIVKVTALLGLFLLVFGVSYALFTVVLNGTKRNRITTGNLSLQLLNEEGNTLNGDTIGLENAVPMTDEEGKATTPYTFTLKNNGTMDAEYSLSLEDLTLETGEEQLLDKYVTMYIEKETNFVEQEGPYLLSDIKNRVIDAGIIEKGKSKNYKVYLWLDEAADTGAMNKVFSAGLKVKGYQVTDKSLANTIVKRYSDEKKGVITTYADGTTRITGNEVVLKTLNPAISNDGPFMAYYMDLIEQAGISTEGVDLSTREQLSNFLTNTADKNETFKQLERKTQIDVYKKYGISQDIIDQYEYFWDYAETIKETNPNLANKLYYENYLQVGVLNINVSGQGIVFDDNIEKLKISKEPHPYQIDELILPKNLKILNGISGISPKKLILPNTLESIQGMIITTLTDETFTIPASVKYVDDSAFHYLQVNSIHVEGSTEGWNANWSNGFQGTIN